MKKREIVSFRGLLVVRMGVRFDLLRTTYAKPYANSLLQRQQAVGCLTGHTLQGQLIALGSALFFISDAFVLGRLLFTADRAVDWAVMILYYSAQLLIGISCLM